MQPGASPILLVNSGGADAVPEWQEQSSRAAPKTRVGIMGLGSRAAGMLGAPACPVASWSRSRKALPRVGSFTDAIAAFGRGDAPPNLYEPGRGY